MGCPGNKATPAPPAQPAWKEGTRLIFPPLIPLPPGLQLLVGLERLQYHGGEGRGKERERDQFGIPPLLLNWGGGWGEAICQRDFQCHRKELCLIRMRICTLKKKKSVLVAKIQTCVGAQPRFKKKKKKALALQCRICEVLVPRGNVGRAHFICLFLLTYCPPDSSTASHLSQRPCCSEPGSWAGD